MKRLFWAIAPAIFALTIKAQTPQRLSASIVQLKDSIQAVMTQEHIAGLMLAIASSDSIFFSGGLGYADLAARRPSTDSTLFRMGSVTKMFVSCGILRLIEQGKLHLQDEVKKTAPEIVFSNAWESTHPLRIVHLLEHTSGFDDTKLNRMYTFDSVAAGGLDMVKTYQHSLVCRWQPGQRTAYANPNYVILGYIIQKITGQPYEVYLQQHILNPLGMRHSNFNLGSRFPERDVREYIVKQGKTIAVPSVNLLSGPQGALWSSATDMSKFLQTLLRNGSPVISAASLTEMETHHSSIAAPGLSGSLYGLGNRAGFVFGKYSYRGHEGLAGTCYSSLNYNRHLNIGFVLASNSNVRNTRIESLITRYIERLYPQDTAATVHTQPLDIAAITPYLGRYQFENPRNEIAALKDKLTDAPYLFLRNNHLYLQPLLGEPEELKQTGRLTFTWRNSNLPLVYCTSDDKGKRILVAAGLYYQQTNNTWALVKRGLLALALLLLASSMATALVCTWFTIRKRMKCSHLLISWLPISGTAALVWGSVNLTEIQLYTYKLAELNSINVRTIGIFAGTSLFGAAALLSLALTVLQFKKINRRWVAWYYLCTSIAMCSIAILLWQNGLLGLRTWAM